MANAWLDLSPIALFGVLPAFYAISAALLAWRTFRSPFSGTIRSLTGVVAPFFGAPGVLFALLTGFLANDAADRNQQAWRAVHGESSAALNLHTLSVAAVPDTTKIRTSLRGYALQEYPFDGAIRISSAPLENVLAIVARRD